jgi:hypothetical protein
LIVECFLFRSNEGPTNLLHIIAQQNHHKILECLFKEAQNHEPLRNVIKWMLKAFDATDSTPLHIAARLGHSKISRQFFQLADLCENPSYGRQIDDKNNSNQNEDDHQDNQEEDNHINQLDNNNTFKINRQDIDSNSTESLSQRRNRTLSISAITPHVITMHVVSFSNINFRFKNIIKI